MKHYEPELTTDEKYIYELQEYIFKLEIEVNRLRKIVKEYESEKHEWHAENGAVIAI